MNIKKILGTVAEFLPFGSQVKSILKGASSLLLKKAAKKVGIDIEPILKEAENLAENDHEIKMALIEEEKERREHELSFYGKFTDLDEGSRILRARVRPLLSFGFCGLFIVYGVAFLCQQLFPLIFGWEFAINFPPELVTITKWVVGFWFGGRTVEKVVDIFKNGKK